jgi:hypothetical protein
VIVLAEPVDAIQRHGQLPRDTSELIASAIDWMSRQIAGTRGPISGERTDQSLASLFVPFGDKFHFGMNMPVCP